MTGGRFEQALTFVQVRAAEVLSESRVAAKPDTNDALRLKLRQAYDALRVLLNYW